MRILLTEEPRGTPYRRLVEIGLERCTHGSLVIRREMPLDPGGKVLLKEMSPSVTADQMATEWPGTRTRAPQRLVTFTLDEPAASVVSTSVQGLFDWRQPARPEDLALLLPDGKPWLSSISHEQVAWVVDNETMLHRLSEAGCAVAEGEPEIIKDRLVADRGIACNMSRVGT